ncbi:uncharacterized protein [Asterias amurensis]|uniref:uncharacterized protein n=1 Tax=Asterias amurensis TaxID=7602 RepID=UPI003AB8B2CF
MMEGKERFSGWVFCVLVVQNVLSCVQSLPVGAANDGDDGGTADDGGQFGFGGYSSSRFVGILFVSMATMVTLSAALVLCACGDNEPKKDGQTEEGEVNGDIEAVNDEVHIVPLSPTPDELKAPTDPQPTAPQNSKPKDRSSSVQSQKSLIGAADEALIRSSTIDRRLPELPPTPMAPVTPTNEEEEDDYNRTYDVIGDTKGANNRMSKVERQPSKEEEIADVEDDDQYACVTDSAANKMASASKPNLKDTNDPAVVDQQDLDEEELDEAYASVVVGKVTETETASYASVGNKDDRNGYARLRSLQKHPVRDSSPDGGEKSGYARLRDVTLESGAVGGVGGRASGGADDEEAPPVPYKPPDLQNEEDADEVSPIERTSSTEHAVAGAVVSVMSEGINTGSAKKKEPPYTQVSARESLDVVRARQQAEQNARIATHYQSIEEDQTLDADHDGIYEPVDDQHVEKQPVMSPPPLPGDRQGPSSSIEPSASNDWQMTKAPRLYEEITDETRPQPTQAAPDQPTDDDIQPYAVTEKRAVPNDAPGSGHNNNISEANYAVVNKVHKATSGQSNNNARTEFKAQSMSDDELPVYAVVEKKSKGQGSKVMKRDSAPEFPPTPQDIQEDSYQSIEDMPLTPQSNTAAIVGGMVHVDEQPTSSNLWQKKEHMYIDVESNKPSENVNNAGGGGHSYEIVSLVSPATSSKKEKQKAAKKAKKESKKEKKHSKGEHHEKGSEGKGEKGGHNEKGADGKGEKGRQPEKTSEGKGGKGKHHEKGVDGKGKKGGHPEKTSEGKGKKGGHHEKSGDGKGEKPRAESSSVWKQQDAAEGNANGNANNNIDEYEDIVFPLQETRL